MSGAEMGCSGKMLMRFFVPFSLAILACSFAGHTCFADDLTRTSESLREHVIKAASSREKGKAYQELFEKLGKPGLVNLTKDKDIGIALQAAWERHKKVVKRPKQLPNRPKEVYDPAEMGKFLSFLADRTKAPVPKWWATLIADLEVYPNCHAVNHRFDLKLRNAKAMGEVAVCEELERKGGNLVYKKGMNAIEFPDGTFGFRKGESGIDACNVTTGVVLEKRAAIAVYSDVAGFPFKVAGFNGQGGKPAWTADVWGAGRGSYVGPPCGHRVELTAKGNTVFVFGAELAGLFVEGFDLSNGKCQFRFCSAYWFNHSEKWNLK